MLSRPTAWRRFAPWFVLAGVVSVVGTMCAFAALKVHAHPEPATQTEN